MNDQEIRFYPQLDSGLTTAATDTPRMEPATCTEAETFVLQVLDDTMEPEFNKGCIIVIDPTGLATDGSYVLARQPVANKSAAETDSVDDYVFRQLSGDAANGYTLQSLNPRYADTPPTSVVLSDIVGVIVQRAGVRRRYHKRYD